ncbi:MAG: DNA-directed RNA polymerase subunit beta, partial [Clostridia bacterium]|nr:DNA-directed RNA polymerase subunit beta [Clostridia bacterium]
MTVGAHYEQLGKNTRVNFAKIKEVQEIPNLIDIQLNSYKWFVEEGIPSVLKESSHIEDHTGTIVLDYIDYKLEKTPKYTIGECKERDATYAAPLKVICRLTNTQTQDIKETEIFFGDFPLMTETGTFIINGAERVVVSQLVRSPGVYFAYDMDKAGNKLFSGTVMPNRGPWVEFESDANDVIYVRVDKGKKVPVTTLLRAFGIDTDEKIKEVFGEDDPRILSTLEKDTSTNRSTALLELYRKLRPGEPATVDGAIAHIDNLFFSERTYDLTRVGRYKYNKKLALGNRISGKILSRPVSDPLTGEIIADVDGKPLTREQALKIEASGAYEVYLNIEEREVRVFSNHMVDMKNFVNFNPREAGVREWVKFPVLCDILDKCSTDKEIMEMARERLSELTPNTICNEDLFSAVNYLLGLYYGIGSTDDIDHLGNRRIRCVGELLQNQLRIGFTRMERAVRERMNMQNVAEATPTSLLNSRPVIAAIREFFGSSPLSQFMDQSNPLAEITHKRRLSALGPGGLTRDRAGFDVRDVHYSHYGRMCPVETPEGPNIGLISYLASFARINEYGFIEAPYHPIDKATGVISEEVRYMTADEEDNYVVAQANEPRDEQNRLLRAKVAVRHRENIAEVEKEKVDYIDISPKQVVSVATSMIPFLENDDAIRALMGANMQRQAVPLLKTESPIVGTGMEYRAAVDSGVCVVSKCDGIVTYVSATEIKIRKDNGETEEYPIIKFLRSNQGTCINQRPIVNVGDIIKKGDVIADGPATSNGELSLGKNMLIGFMTWEGYNYEDAVLLNEKLVKEDTFTSIHVEEYEIDAKETKLGPEEITNDIPGVSKDLLADLDERGIIRIGAEVRAGDILVGKVSPKGDAEQTAEERLLRAIFGEKSREVRDASLKVPHGENGIVVDVKVFTRENSTELSPSTHMVVRVYIAQRRKISVGDKMAGRHGN